MVSAESFWTNSLHNSPHGEAITRILAAAIQAVEPGRVVERAVKRDADDLVISRRTYDLSTFRNVYLLALGKASLPMAESMTQILGDSLTSGLVITKHLPAGFKSRGLSKVIKGRSSVIQGGHPLPNDRSLVAGKRVIQFLSRLTANDLLVCLISGGGSALMAAPLPGVSLSDLQAVTAELLKCGAAIEEINALRRRLDLLKGGGMIRMANQATVVSLILSDVIGNPLESIASGPTAPDPTSRDEALAVVKKYALQAILPAEILISLENSLETPKPDDPVFEKVHNLVVGSNLSAAQAALRQAAGEGFHPYLLRTDLKGEARQAAFELSTFLRQAKKSNAPVPAPACMVAGGETTVSLQGNGRGGRNTELALAAVSELADFPEVMLVSLATDGEDGPTDTAGAVVTGRSFRRAAELGLNPGPYLQTNDSYTFFDALDDLLKPGPTGTNVNDLVFLFTF